MINLLDLSDLCDLIDPCDLYDPHDLSDPSDLSDASFNWKTSTQGNKITANLEKNSNKVLFSVC